MSAAVLAGPARAEAVAVLANMTSAALGGCGERRAEDHQLSPGTAGGGLPAPVLDGAGPRAHRVHDAPVRAGRRGGRARLGAQPTCEVIDTDLGISGRFGVAREGFSELVARVCRGEVGAIFGIEISRLARSNADVARLMEFARITDTLLIDSDGVYDPADVNDRMLLGLKGTMGEVELHVMAGRCRRPSGPPPPAASCAPRCRSATSTTTPARS